METIVKPGFVPTTKCLCTRPGCFYATFRRLEDVDKRKSAERCVACGTTKSALWRTPSSELGLFQRWLSSGESRGSLVKDGGIVLDSGSTLCNACAIQFRDKGKEWVKTKGSGFTTSSFMLYLRQTTPSVKSHELSVSQAQQAVLEVLNLGEPVPLEDGIGMLVKAREALGMKAIGRQQLVSLTRTFFDHLSDTVSDAYYVAFDGVKVGDDNR